MRGSVKGVEERVGSRPSLVAREILSKLYTYIHSIYIYIYLSIHLSISIYLYIYLISIHYMQIYA